MTCTRACCVAPPGAACVPGLAGATLVPSPGLPGLHRQRGAGSARFSARTQPLSLVRSAKSTAAFSWQTGMPYLQVSRSFLMHNRAYKGGRAVSCVRQTMTSNAQRTA